MPFFSQSKKSLINFGLIMTLQYHFAINENPTLFDKQIPHFLTLIQTCLLHQLYEF